MPREVNYKALAERIDLYAQLGVEGCDRWRDDLRTVVTMLNEAAAARPVAWMDEFGNSFPLDAWKPAKRTYLDDHKNGWKPLFAHPAPQPQPNPAMLESHRRLVEQAIHDAEHPSGMSTHDGKARIDASVLRRMLAIMDAPQAQPEQHCAHERFGVAGNVFDSRGVARPYGTDTIAALLAERDALRNACKAFAEWHAHAVFKGGPDGWFEENSRQLNRCRDLTDAALAEEGV